MALAIQAVHGISSDWLLYGKGEMFISNKPDNFKYEEDFDAELMESIITIVCPYAPC